MPDISVLPKLSADFGVSVDALLGLVPLEPEYRPSNSGTVEFWTGGLMYLKNTGKTMWNVDYMGFLVREVWKIEKSVTVLDCGCGYGALGLPLMPLLPSGSRYVGVDFTENMIRAARELYRETDYAAEFILSDILEYRTKEKYDMVISQAVLRHVNNGEIFLRKKVDFARDGGPVVSLECNREFEADGLKDRGGDRRKHCLFHEPRNEQKGSGGLLQAAERYCEILKREQG